KLVAETRDLAKELKDTVDTLIGDEKISSQEARGAKHFALAAMAGELATHYGVTGWEDGDASEGVRECFNQWRADFGKGDIEEKQRLQSVKDFIDKHGDSRFSPATGECKTVIYNRAGYYLRDKVDTNAKDTDDYPVVEYKIKTTYLFNDAGMKEPRKVTTLIKL
ncbi:[similarity to] inner membrane protein, partial [methanotrophic bacterial endosymbiont of Bathymodiolus sp.]